MINHSSLFLRRVRSTEIYEAPFVEERLSFAVRETLTGIDRRNPCRTQCTGMGAQVNILNIVPCA